MASTRTCEIVAVFLCTFTLFAADNDSRDAGRKQPWEWSLEERLAVRFNPEHVREREDASVASRTPAQQESARVLERDAELEMNGRAEDPRTIRHSVDGKRNPELFLPHELFDAILSGLQPDAERRMRQRGFYAAGIRKIGVEPALFWTQLESVASHYVTLKYHSTDSSRAARDEKCRARYDALERARELFGRERFDRYLYAGVAPGSQQSSVTVGVDPIAELRREASGCR